MNLTQNFTLEELCYSSTAEKYKINNNAPTHIACDLAILCDRCLQPIRNKIGIMDVSSGYRSPALNTKVKGSSTSQHCKGQACDFVPRNKALSYKEIFKWINSNLIFDQLIEEFDSQGNHWIHISYNPRGKNRKEILLYKNGVYSKYNLG